MGEAKRRGTPEERKRRAALRKVVFDAYARATAVDEKFRNESIERILAGEPVAHIMWAERMRRIALRDAALEALGLAEKSSATDG